MISRSFRQLQSLVETFDAVSKGRRLRAAGERRAVRLTAALGPTAVPLLFRKLVHDDDSQASWAYFLLCRAGGPRAIRTARELATGDAISDAKKALVLALLAELGAPIPEDATLRDPAAVRTQSVRDLVESLATPADVARAADLLLEQAGLSGISRLLAEMADAGGATVAPLVDEVLLREEAPEATAAELRALRLRLGPATGPATRAGAVRATAWLGARPDGGAAVLVARRSHGGARSGQRLRAMAVTIDPAGRLSRAGYDEGLSPRTGLGRLRDDLAACGYAMRRCPVAQAAQLVVGAARARRGKGGKLPREFFLGRDLLGLSDEHARDDGRADLARGAALLERGQARRARSHLERHVVAFPNDAEGRTLLGLCLLALDEHDLALRQLKAAAHLAPSEPISHWNLAHAAKSAGRLGACYLALVEYSRHPDRSASAQSRQKTARQYLRLFERHARREHPDVSAERVARGEELFHRAHEHFLGGRTTDAITGFQAVLTLVPSHYPSWGNLGAAFLALGRREDAERCLEKALAYRPDYEIARKNLEALRG